MDATRHYHTKWSKSEVERQVPYDITYMWNLKYGTNEFICAMKTDSQREQTCGCQDRSRDGGMDWESGISRYKLLYPEWINNKIFPCTTAHEKVGHTFSRCSWLFPENLWEALKRLFSTWAVQMGQGQVSDLCNDLWSRHLVLFGELKVPQSFHFPCSFTHQISDCIVLSRRGHCWTS